MKVGGQEVNGTIIARIQEIIDSEPEQSRAKLSRRICEELRWRSRNGRLKEVSCRVVLVKLGRSGAIRLPEVARFPARPREMGKSVDAGTEAEICGTLKEFQPVELIRIDSARTKESELWKGLMDRHHYLGSGPLCGAQVRYLVRSSKQGWLGGLAFIGIELVAHLVLQLRGRPSFYNERG